MPLMAVCVSAAVWAGEPPASTGFPALRDRLGPLMPTGAGIPVTQVEAPLNGGYMAFIGTPQSGEFAGKTNFDRTGGNLTSGHAIAVGEAWYGNASGFAPGIIEVESYEAGDYLGRILQWTSTTPVQSRFNPGAFRISNNSWITTLTDVNTQRAVRRQDYQVDTFNYIYVNAVNNGSGTSIPPYPASSYNGITTGLDNGNSSRGPTSFEGAGRCKPDIVAPASFTSFAAPQVAGAAALLLEQGAAIDPSRSGRPQVIKAIMLAGAEKLPDWEKGDAGPADDPLHPLDWRYGAGRLRVDRNYDIMAGGVFLENLAQVLPRRGWSFTDIANAENNDYRVHIATGNTTLSVALAWHRHHSGTFSTDAMRTLNNLRLELWTTDAGGQPLAMLQESRSTLDNVQHIHLSALDRGVYLLRVRRTTINPPTQEGYGLAWWSDGDVLVGDMNGDGAVNNFDIDPFVLALTDQAAFSALYPGVDPLLWGDINGDGALNNFDIDPFVALITGG
jgi:hypothetical protein